MKKIESFFDELLLNSGQYALFYLIMNFSKDGIGFFNDTGHTLLLFILLIQTSFLVYFGNKPNNRLLGNLIAPLFYTIREFNVDMVFVFKISHFFFWVFSFLVGFLQAVQLKTASLKVKIFNEYAITFINITIYIFLYFYLDVRADTDAMYKAKQITLEVFNHRLSIYGLIENLKEFYLIPNHRYVTIGGIVLAFSIAVGRIKILMLNEKIKKIFGRYVDDSIMNKIINHGAGKSEKTELCVLFSDIRNFTKISENSTPSDLTEMLNYYFTEWSDSAITFQGTIDKYIGDAVMMVFNQYDKKDAANNSIKCAIEMLAKMKIITQNLKERGLPVIEQIGIGIHFGAVIAGDIGSKNRVNYTYIGDTVNIASRLESKTKELGYELIISDVVYQMLLPELQNHFKKHHEGIVLKGKSQEFIVYNYVNQLQDKDY